MKELRVYDHSKCRWEVWDGPVLEDLDLEGIKEGYLHIDGVLQLVGDCIAGDCVSHLYENVWGTFVKVY